MSFAIEWSRPARRQVGEIVSTIEADNPLAAEKFIVGLDRRISRLMDFPRSGAVYRRRRGFEVRQITYGNYRIIFYRPRPRLKRIEILSIWHGARQEPPLRGPGHRDR